MTDSPVAHTSVRFTFSSLLGAAQALLMVLEDARLTTKVYRFTGLTPDRVLKTGLLLEGDVGDITRRIEGIDGHTRHEV